MNDDTFDHPPSKQALAELARLMAQLGGVASKADVVQAARDAKTWPHLHAQFEWDDSVAAEKYRLEQAGRLLRVAIVPAKPSAPRQPFAVTVAPAHIGSASGNRGGTYKRTEELQPIETRLVMADELKRIGEMVRARLWAPEVAEVRARLEAEITAAISTLVPQSQTVSAER